MNTTNQLGDGNSIFGKEGNGTLDLMLFKSVEDWPEPYKSDGIRLDISIWYDDLNAIHKNALCAKRKGYLDEWTIEKIQENYEAFMEDYYRNREHFIAEFPECRILGAEYDMYEDYIFDKEKVSDLRRECLQIKEITSSKKADRSLRKLLYGCEAALRESSYLVFVCD